MKTLFSAAITLSACTLLFTSCVTGQSKRSAPVDQHSSESSLDWAGFYASGDTYLTLTTDGRYFYDTRSKSGEILRSAGKFTWSDNGRNIHLPELNLTYWVREGNLALLDRKGNVVESGVLPKEETFLLAGPWRLSELNGTAVSTPSRQEPGKDVYLQFEEEQNRVTGSSGCNRIFGTYENMDERLKLGQLGSTMMACPDMELEQQFTQTIPRVAQFAIENDLLVLQDQTGKPVMKFYRTMVLR